MSFGWVSPFFAGVRFSFKGFRRAERGSVTLQVLFMSIALMGTTGLVLDSGRLYSKHTQMQAFVDQMALAAASELDGRSDSIVRARDAVYGIDDTGYLSKTDSQGNVFAVQWIGFYTDLPPDYTPVSDRQNDISDLLPYLITDENDPDEVRAARYVAVVAVQWKVGNLVGPLSRLITPTGNTGNTCNGGDCDESAIPLETDVQTLAVAAMERVTCADLSTLVFCNPWEGRAGNEYEDQEGGIGIQGRTIRYFAPNFERVGQIGQEVVPGYSQGVIGSPWDYDARNQLHLMVDPISDPGGFCGTQFVLGFTGSGDDDADAFSVDYIEARDRCLLARARAERVCFEETIGIRPAPGQLVVEGVNTAFDIWLPPMDELLLSENANRSVPNTGLTLANYFEPDKSVLSRYWTVDDNGGIYSNNPTNYETIPAPDWTNRVAFPGRFDRCHLGSASTAVGVPSGAACTLPLVSNTSSFSSGSRGQGGAYTNAVFSDGPGDPKPASLTGFSTWYELYQIERGNNLVPSEVTINSASLQGQTPARTSDRPDYRYGAPDTYTTSVGALIAPDHERRKIRAAMVNCQAMYTENDNHFIDDPDPTDEIDGTIEYWDTPVLAILDIHLPEPAGMHCGVGVDSCTADESLETSMMIELIEDVTDEAFTQRFAVSLVR